jgi:hypothetical protein
MIIQQFTITQEENENIIKKYFKEGPEGPLSEFPTREKRKAIIINHLLHRFEAGRKYTEKEVNEILKDVYFDYATLRRYLVDYKHMDRLNDGSCYWVNIPASSI